MVDNPSRARKCTGLSSLDPARSPTAAPADEKVGGSKLSVRRNRSRRKKRLPLAQAYAESHLRRILDLGSTPISVDVAVGGRNSLVYILTAGERRRAVIHLLESRNEWRDTRFSLELGEERNLPIPRLLHVRRRGFLGLGPKYWLLTTDFAEGEMLHKLLWSEVRLKLLADTVARLHAVESDVWGKPRRPRRKPLMNALGGSIVRRLHAIRKHPGGPGDPFMNRLDAFFRKEISSLPEPATFQLCHHHLFGDDMILAPDETGITLLDCSSLQYSRAARDLAAICEGFFPGEEALEAQFLDAYFRNFSTDTRREWERELPLFRALHVLTKFHRQLGRKAESRHRSRLQEVCGLSDGHEPARSGHWH